MPDMTKLSAGGIGNAITGTLGAITSFMGGGQGNQGGGQGGGQGNQAPPILHGGSDGGTQGPGGGGGGGGAPQPSNTGASNPFDDPALNNRVDSILSAPFRQVETHRQIGQAERIRDILTSSSGMDDATRENLIQYFLSRDMGITPEVDEAVQNLSESVMVDWSDPTNVDAIYGTVAKSLEHGNAQLASNVMDWLAEFYQIAMQNPTFDRSEMMSIISDWIHMREDPEVMKTRIQAFLDSATRNWNDPMAAMGFKDSAQNDKSMRARRLFMNILNATSERPDKSQQAISQGARAYQALRQQNYRFFEQWARRMGLPVYTVMDWAGRMTGGAADFVGDYSNPVANTVMSVPSFLAETGTTAHLNPFWPTMVTRNQPITMGGENPLAQLHRIPVSGGTVGGMGGLQGGGRRAVNDEGNVRYAQIQQDYSMPLAPGHVINPPSTSYAPHPQAPVSPEGEREAYYMDIMHSLGINISRSDAAQAALAQVVGVRWMQQLQSLKYQTERIKQDLSMFERDVKTGEGYGDLRLIQFIDQAAEELSDRYDQLLSTYNEMMQMVARRRENYIRSAMYNRQDPSEDPKVEMMDMAMKQIEQERNQQRLEREYWLLKSKRSSHELRTQAREVMTVQPLRSMRDVMRAGVGADAGASMSLAAEEMAQAEEQMAKYRRLRQLDPNISGIQAGRALDEANKYYLQALQDMDRSTQPATSPQERTELLGA